MNSAQITDHAIEIVYLIATALFVLSLKWLSAPATARRGVLAGEIGMALAIGATLLHRGIVDYTWIAIALVVGTIIGIPLGLVQMTAVPQRTALSHAFGALCVSLVGTAEYYQLAPNVPRFMMAVLSMEVILGSLTFTGSLMAAGKLQEVLPQRPITYKGQNIVNIAPVPADYCDSAPVRRAHDRAYWRRRHAHRHFPAEFLRGSFGGGNGICAG
jgi:proton-translocating NAD(P)+ transhydrogenase subunit beta